MVSVNYAELYQNADQSVINNTPLPPGSYPAVVEDAKFKQASTGRNMYVVRFSIESGPHQGRKVQNNFVIVDDHPTALGIHFRQMAAMGVATDWLCSGPDTDLICQKLIGARATIKVGISSNNSDFNSVDGVSPPEGGIPAAQSQPASAAPPTYAQQQPMQPQQQQQQQPMQQPMQAPPQQPPMQPQQQPMQQPVQQPMQQPAPQQWQPPPSVPQAQQFQVPAQQQQQQQPMQAPPQQQPVAPQQAQFEQPQQPPAQQPQQQPVPQDQSAAPAQQLPAPPPF